MAALYSAWNDLRLAAAEDAVIADSAIVQEVLHNWHPAKEARFTDAEMCEELDWMRANDFVPSRAGPRTEGGHGSFDFDQPR